MRRGHLHAFCAQSFQTPLVSLGHAVLLNQDIQNCFHAYPLLFLYRPCPRRRQGGLKEGQLTSTRAHLADWRCGQLRRAARAASRAAAAASGGTSARRRPARKPSDAASPSCRCCSSISAAVLVASASPSCFPPLSPILSPPATSKEETHWVLCLLARTAP